MNYTDSVPLTSEKKREKILTLPASESRQNQSLPYR